ncbi:MAG: magnesium chelatase, partial [Desulfosarcina sp.]
IGVGSRGKAPFLVKDPLFGERYIYQRVNIDEAALKAIANKTGGLYFRAENLKSLEKIYTTIDAMETTEVKMEIFAEYDEMYPWFLLPALALIGVYLTLRHTRYLTIP